MDLRGKILIPALIVAVLALGYLWYQKRQVSSTPAVAVTTSTPQATASPTASPSTSPTVAPTADVDAAVNAFTQEGATISGEGVTTEPTTDPGAANNVDQALSAE